MAEKKSSRRLEAELHAKTDDIKQRIDVLQDEVQSLGTTAKRAFLDHPLWAVGGALLAGTLVGLLFGGSRDKTRQASVQALVDTYLDTIADQARVAIQKGKEPARAVQEALEDRVPLIVLQPDEIEQPGFFKQTFSLLATTASGFAVKLLLDRLTDAFEVDTWIEDQIHSVREPMNPPE